MKRKGIIFHILEPVLRRASRFIAYRLRNRFYIILAVLFSIVAILDTAFFHVTADMKQKTFDLMIRHRIVTPLPDHDIVIVDINEA
ncbi:MAG: molecular chaperone TorD, partial [Nitrospirota bacterium]|nr:molecular chaperone TorD [Nitrospirota bacterium]